MLCPQCGAKSRVVVSFTSDQSVWRERKCPECGHTWTTLEVEDEAPMSVRSMRWKDQYRRKKGDGV